ncbi:MAG: ABC transporter permease [Deltaproteobacteria bacterium]|jgi:ABC-type multidrug transport system permease subunit|nr:ABC transporter permease [Deltaproteobacteria bacterium]
MSAFTAVYLREILILKHRFKRQLAGQAISPLLFMLTFGLALGGSMTLDGHTYLEFLIPGLAAMASMVQGFSLAGDINVARFYYQVFDEIQSAPVSRLAYVLGESLAGLTRVMMAVLLVIIFGFFFGVRLNYGPLFFLALILNGLAFAALGVAMAMLVKSHADQSLLTTFIITPMSFLGGTFFPLDRLPGWAQDALYLLPLSHASMAARAAAFGQTPFWGSYVILTGCLIFFFALAMWTISKAKA